MSHPPLRTLRLAAVNIDGVLLNDTFSPVIHRLVLQHGLTYTADLERAFLSQHQLTAAQAFAEATGSTAGPQEILAAYFTERERYLRTDPLRLLDGAVALLQRLRALGLEIVCYGGLDKDHFESHLGSWASLFTEPRYICTNDFRPGVREITQDFFGLAPAQVVFIDDVAAVAERARELDVPFIGHPSSFAHGFQRSLMRQAGVRHIVSSLSGIDEQLLRAVDREAGEGSVWQQDEGIGAAGALGREELS
ncbi:HAD family phosphatase [Streptomyces sp. NPDC059680]|uniref:HAD family phosphatase n=1 Tax=Streptomyces TaxID=1883 RepID=UPI001E3FDF54|nr:HAD family phosphatase [Streptomyces barringtoniae]MCC5480870.1 HAD family phosphatase [Streptomyces barringtoniae]